MKTTSPIIAEAQNKLLAQYAAELIDGVDLNYEGATSYDPTQDFVLSGEAANRNRIIYWFQSTYGDYVREPFKGGPLMNILGKSLTDDKADEIENAIEVAFLNIFTDLSLVGVKARPDREGRRLVISLIVQDSLRRELIDLLLAVTT